MPQLEFFYAWALTSENLEQAAIDLKTPYAHRPCADGFMAFDLYERLEPHGPLRLVTAKIADYPGYALIPGYGNEELSDIDPAVLKAFRQTFDGEPQRFEEKPDGKGIWFTAPRRDGSGETDMMYRGSTLDSNL
ncbi:hypothetical protein FRC10_003565 [Ceratobasidium sp. 414]|nr:hypothetical protein FRC10_003565 [Ceratobasidium sp. 414]